MIKTAYGNEQAEKPNDESSHSFPNLCGEVNKWIEIYLKYNIITNTKGETTLNKQVHHGILEVCL